MKREVKTKGNKTKHIVGGKRRKEQTEEKEAIRNLASPSRLKGTEKLRKGEERKTGVSESRSI